MANINETENRIDGITFEITNGCNLKCRMCGIWKEKGKRYLTSADISKVLTSHKLGGFVQSVTLTGGEIFTHPGLEKIYSVLLALKIKKVIGGVTLITNGFSKKIHEFLNRFKSRHELLGYDNIKIYFSIDGLEKNHDYQRGVSNSYTNVIENVLRTIREFPKLKIGIKYTLNSRNIEDAYEIYRFAEKYGISFDIKPIESETLNYYHRSSGDCKEKIFHISDEDKKKMAGLLEYLMRKEKKGKKNREKENKEKESKEMENGKSSLNAEYLSHIIHTLKTGDLSIACRTPQRFLFIDSKGYIYPCLYNQKIGNISESLDCVFGPCHAKITEAAKDGCSGCLAYHGSLKKINFIEK